jgi:hypothetical protein
MKNVQKGLIFALCSCIILAHFYRLSTYLINFPNWGDDYLFLSYFTDLPRFSAMEFLRRTVEFHSYIHRFPMARLLTGFYAIFRSEFNFKELTILANLFTISVIYPLAKLLKQHHVNPWHLIVLIGLIYAPNGNLDNFALIGVLQHTTSLVFLIWISYWLSDEKNRSWGIWLSLLYPMFSTEGLAFIPCVLLLLIYIKDARVWLFGLCGIFVFYAYFIGYASPSTIPSSGSLTAKLFFTVKGAIVFIGAAIKKDLTFSLAIGSIFFTNSLFILFRYHQTKNSALLFSALILFQMMAVGAMITLGRGNAQAGDLGVLFSERFSTYGIVFLCITYFAVIQPSLYKLQFERMWLAIPALIWIGISTAVAVPKLKNLKNRLVADVSNAYHFNTNTIYRMEEREIKLLKVSGNYSFPTEVISLKKITAKPEAISFPILPAYEAGINEFSSKVTGILLVENQNKPQLFLPINSLSHSFKIKKDIPFDQKMSRFVVIPMQ